MISIIFTLKNRVGGLVRALQAFQDLGINVYRIESRPSQMDDTQMDFLVDIEYEPKKMEQLGRLLRREVLTMVVGTYGDVKEQQGNEFPPPTPLSATASFGKTYRTEFVNLYSLFGDVWGKRLNFTFALRVGARIYGQG